MVFQVGWWSVRSGIQVDVEVNLRQRCDSHVVKPQRKQLGEKKTWRTYSKPNLLNSKSIQISFAVGKNVSFPLEPLLNLLNLAHVSHISFTFSHLNDFKIPHEFETTRSPYGFSKACRTLPFFFDDAVRINASHERLMTSVDQMQLGVISCLYNIEIMEMGNVSLLIMLPQYLDSLYILCSNSNNPVFSFGKTKRV